VSQVNQICVIAETCQTVLEKVLGCAISTVLWSYYRVPDWRGANTKCFHWQKL